ncbi:MAG TPA: helix-turn-helix transcriptional regulator [Solirubrobacteraceae bacterium]|jgi:transcriptional regulator with XRE-family HTH domain
MNPRQSPPAAAKVADGSYKAERARLLLAFGEKLRAERERRNLSQEVLAGIVNVHRTHLSALEQGLREPGLAMLLILAGGLGIPPHTLLEGLFIPRERKAPTHSKSGRPAPASTTGAGADDSSL